MLGGVVVSVVALGVVSSIAFTPGGVSSSLGSPTGPELVVDEETSMFSEDAVELPGSLVLGAAVGSLVGSTGLLVVEASRAGVPVGSWALVSLVETGLALLASSGQMYLGQHWPSTMTFWHLSWSSGPRGQSTSSQYTTLFIHMQISEQLCLLLTSSPLS